jgi:predicted MFS family arabinose efflux permease
LFGAGIAGSGLALHERFARRSVLPPAVLRSRLVTSTMTMLLLATGGLFGALFVATFLLQDVPKLSALDSGPRVLPLTLMAVLGAPAAGAALRRHGARGTALVGTACTVLGIAALAQLGQDGWARAAVAFALMGGGYAAVMVTATCAVVGDAAPEYAGVVGALKQTSMNIGPVFGIAAASSVLTLTGSAMAGSASRTGPALILLAGFAALSFCPAAMLPSGAARARVVHGLHSSALGEDQ